MLRCKCGDLYFPFTRFGMTYDDVKCLEMCIEAGIGDGVELEVCDRMGCILKQITS